MNSWSIRQCLWSKEIWHRWRKAWTKVSLETTRRIQEESRSTRWSLAFSTNRPFDIMLPKGKHIGSSCERDQLRTAPWALLRTTTQIWCYLDSGIPNRKEPSANSHSTQVWTLSLAMSQQWTFIPKLKVKTMQSTCINQFPKTRLEKWLTERFLPTCLVKTDNLRKRQIYLTTLHPISRLETMLREVKKALST